MESSKGYSLIEVIIVIALVGILSAIAVPSIVRQRNDTILRDSVSMIRADFELARSRAIRENAFVPVLLTANGYTIFIDNGGTGTGIVGNWEDDGDEKVLSNGIMPPGVHIDLANTTFTDKMTRFDGRGYITNTGIITLLNVSGKSATIDMNNRFGQITTIY